jgi:UDP-N-acetylglucosamine--N-acetylmuramyl-(pentapeptide) pyrophosphoryl-undecaprenol N-acetylglucosamine transferase
MATRIMLAAGGTGGHIYPLLAVAEEISKIAGQEGISVELEFIGTGDILNDEAGKLGVKFKNVISPKWRRYFSLMNFVDILKFPLGFFQSLFFVWQFMPDIIFAKGGYASFLPSITAKLMMIPLVIHESDAIPGSTNVFLSKLAKKTYIAIESSSKYFSSKNIEVVGNPIRSALLNGGDKGSALSIFGLDPAKPTILVTGASQGAKKINDLLLLSIAELTKSFQIIHQTGSKNYEEIKKQVEQIIKDGKDSYGAQISSNYRAYPVFDLGQMAAAYAACDVIVSRSGSQIFETAAVGKPAVLIPLKNSGNNHQLANAREIAKYGAIVIEEDNLSPHLFINEIMSAYNNRAELSEKIRGFAKIDAASKIATQILQFVN